MQVKLYKLNARSCNEDNNVNEMEIKMKGKKNKKKLKIKQRARKLDDQKH